MSLRTRLDRIERAMPNLNGKVRGICRWIDYGAGEPDGLPSPEDYDFIVRRIVPARPGKPSQILSISNGSAQ